MLNHGPMLQCDKASVNMKNNHDLTLNCDKHYLNHG